MRLKSPVSNDAANNILLHYVSESNPFCCFSFIRTWRKQFQSRKQSPFLLTSSGKCSFLSCPVKFRVTIDSYNQCQKPSELILTVKFNDEILSPTQKKSIHQGGLVVLGGSNINRIYNSCHHLPFEIGSIQKLPIKSCSLGRETI